MQVLCANVVAPVALTPNLTATQDYSITLGQLWQQAEAVLHAQADQEEIYGLVADASAVEMMHFRHRDDTHALSIRRTGRHPLSLTPESPGLQLLARLCTASPEQLGHKARTVFSRCGAAYICLCAKIQHSF